MWNVTSKEYTTFLGTTSVRLPQDNKGLRTRRSLCWVSSPAPPAPLPPSPHALCALGDTTESSCGPLCPLAPAWCSRSEALAVDQRAGGGGWWVLSFLAPFLLSHRWAETVFLSPKPWGCWVAISCRHRHSDGTAVSGLQWPLPTLPFRARDGHGPPMHHHLLLASLYAAHSLLCK